ncbi:hypothetical protein G7Y89_g8273 [Cudoniella acicularis]|uniref:Zn(2)-C6 fungal-type domain-containing protein n=1 Tax=Cudoniella acicularis TaxID=354080 RepID=A0A8H4W0S0_9HELO|nr:hypothetical protein G7Y89_g8273 [Cudoniella acicularis]
MDTSTTKSSQLPTKKQQQINPKACDRCHAQKLRCIRDLPSQSHLSPPSQNETQKEETPCKRCVKAGVTCFTISRRRTGRPPKVKEKKGVEGGGVNVDRGAVKKNDVVVVESEIGSWEHDGVGPVEEGVNGATVIDFAAYEGELIDADIDVINEEVVRREDTSSKRRGKRRRLDGFDDEISSSRFFTGLDRHEFPSGRVAAISYPKRRRAGTS